MMEPPGGDWVDICFAPAWMVWNAPVRFVVRVEFQRSGVILQIGVNFLHVYHDHADAERGTYSKNSLNSQIPALLITTSNRPHLCTTASTNFLPVSGFPTSPGTCNSLLC